MKKILSSIIFLFVTTALLAADKSKPNIVFILADDLGIGNLSCYGADNFKTPNIDALARGGIRFQHCYGTPLCGPSRAEILTGRYGFRTGMTGNGSGENLKSASEIMISKVLKPAGYVSGCFGKWGQLPLQPGDFGFDEYMRFQNSGVYWKGPKVSSYVHNGKSRELVEGKYMPDLVHELVLDFIKRHRNEPFFAYYSMSHIHGDIVRTPDSAPDSKDLYADNIAYMDKLVGNLIGELDKLKLREKTLVIFVGDNGTGQKHAPRSTIGGKPISGWKSEMLEGGALVPMIANWPGIAPAGKVSNNLMDFSDYLPTFAELAGADLPGVKLDGTSFAPLLLGKKNVARDTIFVQLGRHWYVRDKNWKLNEAGELFDMSGAPFTETLVPNNANGSKANAARKKLQSVLSGLNPTGGKQHVGNPTGKHDKKMKVKE